MPVLKFKDPTSGLWVALTGSTTHSDETANGIAGDGSSANPIVAETSGVWGAGLLGLFAATPDTWGQPVYVDSAGDLRVQPTAIASGKLVTDAIGTYPTNLSLLSIPDAEAAGWPLSPSGVKQSAVALTLARGGGAAATAGVQFHIPMATDPKTQRIMWRTAGPAWGEWKDIGMGRDTDWLPLAISAAGWTQSVILSARQIGSQVFIRGRLTNATFTNPGHIKVGSLPAQVAKPPAAVLFPIACYSSLAHVRSFQIAANGDLSVSSSVASANVFDLYGSYLIDADPVLELVED